MAAVPNGLKSLLFGMGPFLFYSIVAIFLGFAGLACLILGIISGVKYEPILELFSTEWFLIMIGLWIWALGSWLTAYFAAKQE